MALQDRHQCLPGRARQAPGKASPTGEVLWLQPYPDELLDELVADDPGPDAAVVSKETIELAFLVAIQRLPRCSEPR